MGSKQGLAGPPAALDPSEKKLQSRDVAVASVPPSFFLRAFGSKTGGLEATPSAPVKAFDQKGASPFQANVTGLKSTVVTAFL